MTLETDRAAIAEQERCLQFAMLEHDQLWDLGVNLRSMARARDLALVIEIRLGGETVFYTVMPGAAPHHADWARRKRNTVEMVHTSSYAAGLAAHAKGMSWEQESGQPARDFTTHGGSFPLLHQGLGAVGAVTVSGAPQRVDHELVVEALANLLGVAYRSIALD